MLVVVEVEVEGLGGWVGAAGVVLEDGPPMPNAATPPCSSAASTGTSCVCVHVCVRVCVCVCVCVYERVSKCVFERTYSCACEGDLGSQAH